MTRYPAIRVNVRSEKPLALVAAVRHALRAAGIARSEIRKFSDEACGAADEDTREICRRWVAFDN